MYNIIKSIQVDDIVSFYHSIEHKLEWSIANNKGKQSGIQFTAHENPFLSATGKTRLHDKLFTNLNKLYKDTIIENLINELNLVRTRWMWVYPNACYSVHSDLTPRVHIPLITHKDCMFVFPPNNMFHLDIGSAYWVDTRKLHTFMNCSDFPRLHLVGAVLP